MARSLVALVALFAAGLTACTAEKQPTGNATPYATATEPCPDPDFEDFLQRYSSDISVQEVSTADPLTLSAIDPDAQPEPATHSRHVPLEQVQWPVIPDLAIARRNGRDVLIHGQNGQRTVTLRTPDGGDQQQYHFYQQPCWTLVRIEDQSV